MNSENLTYTTLEQKTPSCSYPPHSLRNDELTNYEDTGPPTADKTNFIAAIDNRNKIRHRKLVSCTLTRRLTGKLHNNLTIQKKEIRAPS